MMGAPKNTAAPVIRYSGLRVSTSQLDAPVALFWGQRRLTWNAIDYVNFQAKKAGKKGGGGKKGGQTQYNYSATVVLALGEGPIVNPIVRIFAAGQTNTTTTLAALGATPFYGTSVQTPWSTLPLAHQLAYKNLAYIGVPNLALGYTPTVPDYHFECQRTNGFAYTHSTPGWINPVTLVQDTALDVLLSDCLSDMLTNARYGLGFTAGDFANLSDFATYNRAQGIFASPYLTTQEKATSIIDRWAQIGNTWIFWDGAQVRCVPLGDTAITANGVTYTPVTTVQAVFQPGDLIGDPRLTVTLKDPADCYNTTRLTITDRTVGYVSNPFEYKDQTLVDSVGLRDQSSVQADEICDPLVAQVVAQLIGKRTAYIRRTYKWKASYRFLALLPGDIVDLNEPNIGLVNFPVRLTGVSYNPDDTMDFTAEEYTGSMSSFVASNPSLATPSALPNLLAVPSSVNTPAIVEPDSAFTGGQPVILIAASGTTNWGGCLVTVSFDNGATFTNIGQITAPATQGTLTGTLADHADPDTLNTLAVDTTESGIVIGAASHSDADNGRTLSLVASQPVLTSGVYVMPVNGELLAYGAVSATGTFTANLTYLRRAQYGSAHSAHSSGDQFSELDVIGVTGTTLRYALPPQYIGTALIFKFQSYNQAGQSLQDQSTCLEYGYTPTGLGYGTGSGGVPATPTGLTASAGISSVALSWNANAPADNATGYLIFRANGTGAPFGSASLIATVNALNYTDGGLSANTGYTYFLEAQNAAGDSVHTAGVNATTATANPSVSQISFYCQNIATRPTNAVIGRIALTMAATLPSGGSLVVDGKVDNAPGADTTFTVLKDGSSVATIKWASGSTTPVVVTSSGSSGVAGDYFDLQSPASLNGMSGVFSLSIQVNR